MRQYTVVIVKKKSEVIYLDYDFNHREVFVQLDAYQTVERNHVQFESGKTILLLKICLSVIGKKLTAKASTVLLYIFYTYTQRKSERSGSIKIPVINFLDPRRNIFIVNKCSTRLKYVREYRNAYRALILIQFSVHVQ